MKTKPISFIHDSLEFDIHPRELFISCQKITSMMNDIPNNEFGIPSKAELTIGMSMGDENEVTYLEETENGGIIELQGYENDLDAILENWREVYTSVEYTDDLDSAEEIYPGHSKIGTVASGDQFVCDKCTKENIILNTNALCTEMEGAAIAHTAWRNGIPFVVIRAISDKADDSAQMDYPTFEAQAIENSVLLLKEMIKQM
jgi:nucleoside phosphorylase